MATVYALVCAVGIVSGAPFSEYVRLGVRRPLTTAGRLGARANATMLAQVLLVLLLPAAAALLLFSFVRMLVFRRYTVLVLLVLTTGVAGLIAALRLADRLLP